MALAAALMDPCSAMAASKSMRFWLPQFCWPERNQIEPLNSTDGDETGKGDLEGMAANVQICPPGAPSMKLLVRMGILPAGGLSYEDPMIIDTFTPISLEDLVDLAPGNTLI